MKSATILLVLCFYAFSFDLSNSDIQKIDSVFNNCPGAKYHRMACQSPRTYVSFTSLDINYDIKTIVSYLLNEKNHSVLFHWFNAFEKINAGDSTYYYELVYGPFGYWSLIRLQILVLNDSLCEFAFYQNHDTRLNDSMGKRCKRLFLIENADQIMKWKLAKIEAHKTRVGFTVQSVPTIYIPNWLYKFTINTVIPDCLEDIEKGIKKQTANRSTEK